MCVANKTLYFCLPTHSMNKLKNKKKFLLINGVLFAFLFMSVSYNKNVIRPVYSDSPVISILSGSYPNFIAALIISLFPVGAILTRNISVKKSRLFFYAVAVLVFILLTIEEIWPYVNASKVYDLNDIIASGLGSLTAILIFELFIVKHIKKKLQKTFTNIPEN